MTTEEKKLMLQAIRRSKTRPKLESKFKDFKVVDTQAKVDILKEAMCNPEVFFSSGELDIEQQYETILGAFLTGIWKKGSLPNHG
jgi:hypothetical protein